MNDPHPTPAPPDRLKSSIVAYLSADFPVAMTRDQQRAALQQIVHWHEERQRWLRSSQSGS